MDMLSGDINAIQSAYKDARDSNHLTGRAEIVDYYQDTYGDNWRKNIVDALVELTGGKRASVRREFEYDKRLGTERYKSPKVTKATQAKYEKLGKLLPPKGKDVGVHIKANLWMSRRSYFKDIQVVLSPEEAATIMSDAPFDAILEAWDIDAGNVEEIELLDADINFF